jgi:hypothetical protein
MVQNKIHNKAMFVSEYVSLMCPKCLNMIDASICNNILVTGVIDVIKNFYSKTSYSGICPNCEEDVDFQLIDGNMSQIIKILNDKGYYTAYCCEGHVEQDDYTGEYEYISPYIYFYFWKDSNILKTNPLPDTWYMQNIDKSCKIFTIYDNFMETIPDFICESPNRSIYIEWVKNNWNAKNRLKDIYDWAIGLPDKSEYEKINLKKIVDEHGEKILKNNAEKILRYYEN